MAPKRLSNGRSPLVNQQRQITAFFSSKASSSPSPSHSPVPSKQTSKSQPNPNPVSKRSPSPSPTTPSPLQTKPKKPLLVIGPSPSSPLTPDSAKKFYKGEAVNKRIRVYWPLDKSWYEGCVKSFDKISNKHLVQYDDADEELLDLANEKIEWIEEETKRFRRLRRVSVIEDEEEEAPAKVEEESGGDDDSADEDWGKNTDPEAAEGVSEDMELVDEDDEDAEVGSANRTRGKNLASRKRKISGGGELGSSKKSKGAEKSTCRVSLDGNGNKVTERNGNGSK